MNKPKVLVVEDERIIARDIEATLKRAGYTVPSVAATGEEAIALAGMLQPDLILMDIVLRGEMDGIEAAGQIHSKYGIPIIYLTAFADKPILERARSTEPIGYVVKPFNEKDLLATIEITLHQYIAQRQRADHALRVSEERFSSAFQFAPIGMALIAQDGHLLKVNRALCDIFGYSDEELTDIKIWDFTHPEDINLDYDLIRQLLSGEIQTFFIEKHFIHKLGKIVVASMNVSLVRDPKGIPLYFIAQIQDITERKQAEEALRNSEERFRQLVTSAPDAVFGVDQNGRIIFANMEATRLLGYEYDEFVGKDIEMIVPVRLRDKHIIQRTKYITNPHARPMGTGLDILAVHKDGRGIPVDINLGHFETASGLLVIAFMRNITERKLAEEALRESEARLKGAEMLAQLGHWELDLKNNSLYWSDETFRIFEIDPAQSQASYQDFLNMIHPDDRERVDHAYAESVKNGSVYNIDHRLLMKDGNIKFVHEQGETYYDENGNAVRSLGTVQDITERKLAETRILALNRLYATISQINKAIVHAHDQNTLFQEICRVAIEDGQYLMAWIGLVQDSQVHPVAFAGHEDGYLNYVKIEVHDETLGLGPTGMAIREAHCVVCQSIATESCMMPWRESALQRGYHSSAAVPFRKGGLVIGALSVYAPEPNIFTSDDEDMLNQIGLDISFALDSIEAELERKNAEAALRERLKEITCLYAIQHDQGLDLSVDELCERIIQNLVPAMQSPEITVPLLNLNGKRFTTPAWHEGLTHRIHADIISHGQILGQLAVYYSRDEAFILPEEQDLLEAIAEGLRLWLERKQAREDLARQIEQLRSLRSIDQAIVTSTDLTSILELLTDEVLLQSGADAADILLFNAKEETLTFAVGRGFHTDALKHSRLKLGEGLAGRAALERRHIIEHVAELGTGRLGKALSRENFTTYHGIPLITNERLRGVLEIFHGKALNPNDEWLNLLESLAKQAAIAIDKAELFDELQNSNKQLKLAYDTSLEGWSKALDLRDEETEGHTRRVTEMTVQLARKFGFNEEELVHIRRGALLHDIGKMGIPDGILLKPAPLTDDEWKIMKKHPVYAYEMLSPIQYLQPAMDIPYCHHERWDGSGYPQGLKGEEIPLAARIFMVVDIWDALTSERPYRAAWSEEKVLEYILSLSDIQLDKKVVDIFTNFIAERMKRKE